MSVRRCFVLSASLVLTPIAWQAARADCDSGIQHLQAVIEGLDPGQLKTLVTVDLRRALRDLDEADETECAQNLGHADRLLHTLQ